MNTPNLLFFIEKVRSRLEKRKSFSPLCIELHGGHTQHAFFVYEKDVTEMCYTVPGAPANFDCSTYTCPEAPDGKAHNCTGYGCTSPSKYNVTCVPPHGKTFECSVSFDCSLDDMAVYDCNWFRCTNNFDCKALADYSCTGPSFRCIKSFDCSSGHLFLCTAKNVCEDSFNCQAGGKQDWDCNGPVDKGRYNMTDLGEDKNVGDFGCGWNDPAQPGIPDSFDCNTFDCKGTDDFFCVTSSNFICGRETTGNFECKSQASSNQFYCRDMYTCASESQVNCGESAGTEYQCQNSYAVCKSTSQKECKKDYKCPAPNNCVSPDFTCNSPFGGSGA